MKKSLVIVGVSALVLVGAFYALNSFMYEEVPIYGAKDYKDVQYVVDRKVLRLGELGLAYFGNELHTDLDGDGRKDVAFLVTHQPGGSGTFYYVVAALKTERGYVGSEGLLLGDRIAPQTTERSQNPVHKGVIIVNYAERAPGEPMTAQPSVGKSIWLKLNPQSIPVQWGEVAQNFEGESNLPQTPSTN